MIGALVLAAVLLGMGFLWGAAWEHDRQESLEQRRADELWQVVKRQIIEDRETFDRAEAHARFLPEKLRRAPHAAKN